jgi:hypothetical protein
MKTLHLLASGVGAWIVGLVILYVLAWPLAAPEGAPGALMWALGHWWVAFAFGLVKIFAVAAFWKTAPWRAAGAYVLPVALVVVLAGLCLLVYPNPAFREELTGYLPVCVVFYVLGLGWAYLRRDEAHALARVILPPAAGGLLVLAFVAIPAFGSNAFLYRDAFSLRVLSIERPGPSMAARCILEIRKPGAYVFSAPGMLFPELAVEYPGDAAAGGEIVWGREGEPQAGDSGTFPLTIRYEKVPEEDVWPGGELGASSVVIEVRDAAARDRILRFVAGRQ